MDIVQKQLNLKIKQLEKNKIDMDSLKEDHKAFIKNSKLILKQRFRTEKRNVFIEEIKKIALNSNDDKRRKSTDSIKT